MLTVLSRHHVGQLRFSTWGWSPLRSRARATIRASIRCFPATKDAKVNKWNPMSQRIVLKPICQNGWIPLVFVGFKNWRLNLATLLPCILYFHIFLGISSCCGFKSVLSPASPFRNLCFFLGGKKWSEHPNLWGFGRKMAKWLNWLLVFWKEWGTESPPKMGDDGGWFFPSFLGQPGYQSMKSASFLDHIYPPPSLSSGTFCVDDFLSAMHGYRCGWGEIVEVAGRVRFSGLAKAWEKFWCFWSVKVAPKFSMDTKKWPYYQRTYTFSKFSF